MRENECCAANQTKTVNGRSSCCGLNSESITMGNAFRAQPFPALYGENKTPVTEDVLEVGLLVAFSMIAFSFILIIPGIRGWEVS